MSEFTGVGDGPDDVDSAHSTVAFGTRSSRMDNTKVMPLPRAASSTPENDAKMVFRQVHCSSVWPVFCCLVLKGLILNHGKMFVMSRHTVWIYIMVPDTSVVTIAATTVCHREEDPLMFGHMHEVVLSTVLRPCLSLLSRLAYAFEFASSNLSHCLQEECSGGLPAFVQLKSAYGYTSRTVC